MTQLSTEQVGRLAQAIGELEERGLAPDHVEVAVGGKVSLVYNPESNDD